MTAPLPSDEERRLQALQRYLVLDTPAEEGFDRITELAARLFETPVALVALVDRDRQWFKSHPHIAISETARDEAFSAYSLSSPGVFVVLNAASDDRFSRNRFVTGDPFIRFYASAPLITPDGFHLGSLCIFSPEPRDRFSEQERKMLDDLAKMVMATLDLRLRNKQLEESESRRRAASDTLQAVLQACPLGIWLQDPSGSVTYRNPVAAQVFSSPNHHPNALDIPTEVDRVFKSVFALGEPIQGLERVYDKDSGDARDLAIWAAPVRNSDGDVLAGVGVVADITEGKRTELLLHETEARRAALLETALDAILILDGNRLVMDLNPAAESIFLSSRADTLGVPVHRFVPTLERPELPLIGRRIETEAIRSNGNTFPAEVSVTRIDSPGGFYAVYVRDITKRREAEEMILRQASQLAQSNSDLQQFAHLTSHDLKEPLRIISAYARWLQDRYKGKLDADADEFLGYIVDSVQRMEALIRDLLAYSRVVNSADIPLIQVESQGLLEQATANLQLALMEKGAKLTHDPLPGIRANETLLVHVFQNLIGNAIKYSREDGVQIHVSAQRGLQCWLFSVTDNGIGIAPQHLERIFGLFKRLHTSSAIPGTGMGLSICRKILAKHGGRIWATSEIGKGSTFYFEIPD